MISLVIILKKQILHVDVNNAFLSWTAVDRLKKGEILDIRTIPSVIGGDESSRHGIILAKNIQAKQFGIRTGEAIYQARKKCPEIQVYQGNYDVYKQYSDQLYQLLLEYTDQIERFSIDECFLDMTLFLRKEEKLIDKAYEINRRVKKELGFTVNVGVANNKILAKMASDFEKPDKVHTLYLEEIKTKMWILPASELFMVGRKSMGKLEQLGVRKIEDIAILNPQLLIKKFGKHGKTMWEYANGIDTSEVVYQQEKPKCIGNSITLPKDITNSNQLYEILLALSEQVGFRLRKQGLYAQVISVQIKTNQFLSFSHQKRLENPTNLTKDIYIATKQLLETLQQNQPVRLIGIRVDKLFEADEIQMSLFGQKENQRQEKIDQTLDILKKKYGYDAITRAGELQVKDMLNIRKEKQE